MATSFATVVALLPIFAVGSSTGVRLDGDEVPLGKFSMKVVWILDKTVTEEYDSDKVEDLRMKAEDMINQNIPDNGKVLRLKTAHIVKSDKDLPPEDLKIQSTRDYINELDGKYGLKTGFIYVVLSGSEKPLRESYFGHFKTACKDLPAERLTIVRLGTDEKTVKVIVRRFAILLGIKVDYTFFGYRTAKNGQSCEKGLLDRLNRFGTKWTHCSKDDFIDLYNEKALDCLAHCAK